MPSDARGGGAGARPPGAERAVLADLQVRCAAGGRVGDVREVRGTVAVQPPPGAAPGGTVIAVVRMAIDHQDVVCPCCHEFDELRDAARNGLWCDRCVLRFDPFTGVIA